MVNSQKPSVLEVELDSVRYVSLPYVIVRVINPTFDLYRRTSIYCLGKDHTQVF